MYVSYNLLFCRYSSCLLHGYLVNCVEEGSPTHSWPWNTSWDSSAIFHTLTDRSRPPVVTQRSRLKQSRPVMASWWPNLQQNQNGTVSKYSWHFLEAGRNYGTISHSQSLHVRVLVYVPHFNRTVMRGAVEVVSPPPEWKTLRREMKMRQWKSSEIQRYKNQSMLLSEWGRGSSLKRGLCVLWIYRDVCMFLLPRSWSACSYHQWPTGKKMD